MKVPHLVFVWTLVISVTALAQSVPPYPNAITDRVVRIESPMPAPPINTVFNDPDFGSLMVRVTDGTTFQRHPGIYFRNPAVGETNTWSADGRKFYFIGQGGHDLAFAFDPSTMMISSLPGAAAGQPLVLGLRPGPMFSFVDPDLVYGVTNAHRFTISAFRFSTRQITPLIDTTTCGLQPALDVENHRVQSNDDLSLSADDSRIAISEGGSSAAKEVFVIVYDKNLGCRWYNTQTGQIGGQWGPSGYANVPGFLIGHARLSGDGNYVKIHETGFGHYFWDVNTLNVTPCQVHVNLDCAGYGTLGRSTFINAPGHLDAMNIVKRPIANLTALSPLVWPLETPYSFEQETHFVWVNGYLDDNSPVCASLHNYDGDTSIARPWDDEIICMETDLLGSTVWRFAHHRTYLIGRYFNTQPLGNISLDGRFFLFTSTWDGELGLEPDGTPRSDMWIVKLD